MEPGSITVVLIYINDERPFTDVKVDRQLDLSLAPLEVISELGYFSRHVSQSLHLFSLTELNCEC